MKFSVLCLITLLVASTSFGFCPVATPGRRVSLVVASSSSSSDDNSPFNRASRIEGNSRQPNEEEVKIMDEMINKLANAKPYELPNAVRRAFRVISSPPFFMRIASLTDAASDAVEKEKLAALASNLVATLEAVVETTEEQLDERAKEVEVVVKAAAEPDSGEFLVPLSQDRLVAMRQKLQGLEPNTLDEGFLSTVDAWMNKSHLDGMDLMVQILQSVLQMYAGTQILRAKEGEGDASSSSSSPAAELFHKLLQTESDNWDAEIQKAAPGVTPSSLKSEVQRAMETIVLGLESGSMAQQVQAEYLRELVTRVEKIEKLV
ncbi:expressed unknown protein [Seminavis robusta]|uniref:Uncharacterized protein n=1 Tax=Seminavis robusta TaxID=568900 RepID=A0A9N8D9C1_9STRA|nr:expressed unknown protein [Seminavis robusta]|eukprot:Sro45_g027190.1 n/a (319) ;mRNA; f:139298-140334